MNGMMKRRVVVTGVGMVSPLGVTVAQSWQTLLKGRGTAVALTGKEFANLPSRIASVIDDNELRLVDRYSSSDNRQWPRSSLIALTAAQQAMEASKLDTHQGANWKDRCGVSIGSGMVDFSLIGKCWSSLIESGPKSLNPHLIPQLLLNTPAGFVSIRLGLRGPNLAPTTACAAGLHSICESFWSIKEGRAEVMLCGGAESCINPLSIAAFGRMRALATAFNDQPTIASRPFDAKRNGFVLGEGSAVVVLESLDHYQSRSNTDAPLAEILGCGVSSDAHHISSPSPGAVGAEAAMRMALNEAQIQADDVGLVNAHATSTPQGDSAEASCIERLTPSAAVTACKGALGHLLGAAGAAEFAFTVLSVNQSLVPPTANLSELDPSDVTSKLNHVIGQSAEPWANERLSRCGRRVALKNSFGFGGTNASVCVASFQQ